MVGASVEQRLVLIAVKEVHSPLVPLHYSLYKARGKQARSVRIGKSQACQSTIWEMGNGTQRAKKEKESSAPGGRGADAVGCLHQATGGASWSSARRVTNTKVEQGRRDYDTSIISDFPRRLVDAHYS